MIVFGDLKDGQHAEAVYADFCSFNSGLALKASDRPTGLAQAGTTVTVLKMGKKVQAILHPGSGVTDTRSALSSMNTFLVTASSQKCPDPADLLLMSGVSMDHLSVDRSTGFQYLGNSQ